VSEDPQCVAVAIGTSVVFPLFGDDVRLVKARTIIAETVS
jgi:hypothetical protein